MSTAVALMSLSDTAGQERRSVYDKWTQVEREIGRYSRKPGKLNQPEKLQQNMSMQKVIYSRSVCKRFQRNVLLESAYGIFRLKRLPELNLVNIICALTQVYVSHCIHNIAEKSSVLLLCKTFLDNKCFQHNTNFRTLEWFQILWYVCDT